MHTCIYLVLGVAVKDWGERYLIARFSEEGTIF